jgi:uncharacterized spore protein YtfJ
MEGEAIWAKARELMTVERVFGEPFEKDGLTVIPVAAIRGGGGGGGGQGNSPDGELGTGFGSGFGVSARPVGAYVVGNGRVEWHEATDRTRLLLGWQTVTLIALFALRSMFKQRSKTKRRRA